MKIEIKLRRASESNIAKIYQGVPYCTGIKRVVVSENAPLYYDENGWALYKKGNINDIEELTNIQKAKFSQVWRKTATLGGCGKLYVR